MGISQPTFHRILNSAREKIAKTLVEGKIIKIEGGDYVTDKKRYRCKNCRFEWSNPKKEYEKCPNCESEDIYIVVVDEGDQKPAGQPGMGRRQGYGRGAMGSGPPRACKCNNCGYETSKTPGVPCRNSKCPECGAPLCGAD
jgi:predicted Zn-ribbon and HTH transcriptional regulator